MAGHGSRWPAPLTTAGGPAVGPLRHSSAIDKLELLIIIIAINKTNSQLCSAT